jgi:hypothetical protein
METPPQAFLSFERVNAMGIASAVPKLTLDGMQPLTGE